MANKNLEGKSEAFNHLIEDLGFPQPLLTENEVYESSCICGPNCDNEAKCFNKDYNPHMKCSRNYRPNRDC